MRRIYVVIMVRCLPSKAVTGELVKSCENEMKLEHLNYPEYPYECSESIVFQPTDDIDLTGYYVHPYLVPYLMQWLKTADAIKVSKMVNYVVSNNYMQHVVRERVEYKAQVDCLERQMRETRVEMAQMHIDHAQAKDQFHLEMLAANNTNSQLEDDLLVSKTAYQRQNARVSMEVLPLDKKKWRPIHSFVILHISESSYYVIQHKYR